MVKELTMGQRKGVTAKLAKRYRGASKKEKGRILDTLVKVTEYNRCYASWVLRHYGRRHLMKIDGRMVELVALNTLKRQEVPRPRIYDEPVVKTLKMIWESFDYMCGQRLAEFLKEVLPVLVGSGEVYCSETTYEKLLKISPATIDRLLRDEKQKLRVRGTSHTKAVGILKAQIPIRTWSEVTAPEPGHFQIDLVGHDGGDSHGQFAYSLDALDLYSGWVEPRALQNRAHRWTLEAVQDIYETAPMSLKTIHSDNGGEFINERLLSWCQSKQIDPYRSRAYKKNDTCFIEQKNYSVIRQAVGYARFDTQEEVKLLQELYSNLRLLVNHFYPSTKLIEKKRVGSKVHKRYDKPKTPYRRLLECEAVSEETKEKLRSEHRRLRPMELKKRIMQTQDQLYQSARRKQNWSFATHQTEEDDAYDDTSSEDFV